MTNFLCSLCHNEVSDLKISTEKNSFCCHGCYSVYHILESASALEGFENHPVFRQALKYGVISNPQLIEQVQKKESTLEKRKWQIEIQNMWCFSCAELIKLILLKNKGISACVVDYATDLASIEYYPQLIAKENIAKLIESLGYQVKELNDALKAQFPGSLYFRFILSSFCALNVMMFAYPLYAIYLNFDMEGLEILFSKLSLAFSLPVISYCAFPLFVRCYHGIKVGFLGMEVLVSLGITAAFMLSVYEMYRGTNRVYFDSMTVIVSFVLLGKMIEAKAKFSTKEILFGLYRALPQKARKVFSSGVEQLVSLKEIKVDDLVSVHQGEKIVLDGDVEKGQGACDESLITGESLPIFKQPGSQVIAGALMQSGSLIFRVKKLFEQSSLQKIITLIEQDIGKKAVSIPYVDKIAKIFVPFVCLLAFATLLVSQEGFISALSVLLISCPCAIGIAAPLAESNLISQLANRGVIVRNRKALQHLGAETVFVFDKTGTITEGKFYIVQGHEDLNAKHLSIIKTMTARSAHPLSYAICHSIHEEQIPYAHLEEIPGKGMKAFIAGEQYFLGSYRFLKEEGIHVEASQSQLTTVYYATKKAVITTLLLDDKIREDAKKIRSFFPEKKFILLSGDNEQAVARVGKELQFDEWHFEKTPFEKKSFIEKLKDNDQIVFMIGDGINDALAIASAHVGASVVSASDLSIQVSDLLLTNSLNTLQDISELGKRGKRIVKQNFFWAFFYNVIGIGLAAAGLLSPIFSAFAMTASSIIVLFNSKRITYSNPK